MSIIMLLSTVITSCSKDDDVPNYSGPLIDVWTYKWTNGTSSSYTKFYTETWNFGSDGSVKNELETVDMTNGNVVWDKYYYSYKVDGDVIMLDLTKYSDVYSDYTYITDDVTFYEYYLFSIDGDDLYLEYIGDEDDITLDSAKSMTINISNSNVYTK